MTPEQAQAAISQAAKKLADTKELLERLGLLAEAASKRQAPVLTGNLRRSIASRVESADRAMVGTTASYARYVHDGTKYQEGQPFFDDALTDIEPDVRREMEAFGASIFSEIK